MHVNREFPGLVHPFGYHLLKEKKRLPGPPSFEQGPVLLAVNHPDSQMDAFVLSSEIKRKVHYIAHAGLFANKLRARLLRSCGVIPVFSQRGKSDEIDRNVEAFQECYEVLERGEVIGIFPEGISEMARRVRKIKTGAARIVLESERRRNYELGVKLIPIGLHFFSLSRFLSRVLVNLGDVSLVIWMLRRW